MCLPNRCWGLISLPEDTQCNNTSTPSGISKKYSAIDTSLRRIMRTVTKNRQLAHTETHKTPTNIIRIVHMVQKSTRIVWKRLGQLKSYSRRKEISNQPCAVRCSTIWIWWARVGSAKYGGFKACWQDKCWPSKKWARPCNYIFRQSSD